MNEKVKLGLQAGAVVGLFVGGVVAHKVIMTKAIKHIDALKQADSVTNVVDGSSEIIDEVVDSAE